MSVKFAHPPVVMPSWQEGIRRLAGAVSFLLEKQPTKGLLYGATFIDRPIPVYPDFSPINPYQQDKYLQSDYSIADPISGIITLNDPGIYGVGGDMVIENGTINNQYYLVANMELSGVETNVLLGVSPTWTGQTQVVTLGGARTVEFNIGDTVRIGVGGGATDTVDIVDAGFYVEQVT